MDRRAVIDLTLDGKPVLDDNKIESKTALVIDADANEAVVSGALTDGSSK